VPTGDEQRDRGLGQPAVLQLIDGDVRGEVVDAVERDVEREGVGLGRGDAHQQRAGETGSRGDRHGVDVPRGDTCVGQRPVHGRDHRLEVRPGGDLGHHAAEPLVLVHRRGQCVGQQCVPAHQPDAGLVARGLETEHERLTHGFSRFITTASAPLGW
jgi:hypothetical protein